MSDLEAQKDELEALQSIYTNEEFKVNANDEESGGQFFAHIDLPSNFNVIAKRLPYQKAAANSGASGSSTFAETFNIEHVPPIVLYVTLPPNYPSEAMPKYLLSCKWLTRGKLSKICRHLDKLWEENNGMEILFIWTQFLKEEILQFLNITSTLDVSTIYTKQISYLEKKRAHQQKSRFMKIQDSQNMKPESETVTNPCQSSDEKGRQPTQVCKAQPIGALLMPVPNQQAPIPIVNVEMRPSSSTMTAEASTRCQREYDSGKEHFNQGKSQTTQLDKCNRASSQKCNKSTNQKFYGQKFQHGAYKNTKTEETNNKIGQSTLNPEAPTFVQQSGNKIIEGSTSKNVTRPRGRQYTKHTKSERANEKSYLQVDSRTVFDLPMTEPICLALQQFDKQQAQVIFARTSQECTVCFSSKPGSDCIKFDACGHIFCCQCIRGYFEVQVRDGNVTSLKCLEDKCNTEASPAQVKAVLSAETFAKYDAALLAVTLDTLSDIVYCPRRVCQYPVSIEAEDGMGRCPSCQYVFCIFCKMTYHGVEPCKLKSEEQQKLVNDYNTGNEEARSLLERRYGRKQLQRLVDTVLSEQWVSTNSQNCPRCNVSIEKSSGCNKMTCWKCGCFFCWLCLTKLDLAMPYLHFNRPNTRCFNRLFEGIDEDDDEGDEDDDFDDDGWLDFEFD
ncbi:hypothetical protein B566_EDAN013757 [Ephemera danica]|nr:hypothetical protein B566_EDAN013757 [Ephemera danica]